MLRKEFGVYGSWVRGMLGMLGAWGCGWLRGQGSELGSGTFRV